MFMVCLDKVMLPSRTTRQDDVINYQYRSWYLSTEYFSRDVVYTFDVFNEKFEMLDGKFPVQLFSQTVLIHEY